MWLAGLSILLLSIPDADGRRRVQDEPVESAQMPIPLKAKIFFVTDPVDQKLTKFDAVVNLTASFFNTEEFQRVTPLTAKSASESLCNASSYDFPVAIISTSQRLGVQRALQQFAVTSAVPVIQLDVSPWFFAKVANRTRPVVSGTGNFVRFVSPEVTAFSMLPELVDALPMKNAAVLYDKTYPLDNSTSTMLRAAKLRRNQVQMLMNESSAPKAQVQDLLARDVRNIMFLANADNVASYIQQIGDDMTSNLFKAWVFFTTDATSIQVRCDECTAVDLFWVNPTLQHMNYSTQKVTGQYKKFLQQRVDAKDFNPDSSSATTLVDQFMANFFFDSATILLQYLTLLNNSAVAQPVPQCSDAKAAVSMVVDGNATTLYDFVVNKQMEGVFGPYVSLGVGEMYQEVKMKIARMEFIDESRQTKLVGNWTPTQGIIPIFETLDVNIHSLNTYSVAILLQPPFIQRKEDNPDDFEGYCIELIQKIGEIVHFNYTLHLVVDGEYGNLDSTGDWSGLVRELIDGIAEIALAPLSVMAERENVVDFTVPYYDLVGTTILMRKTKEEPHLFKFLSVLKPQVWGSIIGAYFAVSFLLWILDRLSPFSYTNCRETVKNKSKREFTLKECLWFSMTSLTPQGGGEAPRNISGRMVAASWWLFGFIIIASYTANLAAFLTVSRLETQISSLDDLAKQYEIKYAPVKGSASETYFKRMAAIEEKFYEIWKSMSLNESASPSERAQLAVWDYPVSDKFSTMWQYMKNANPPLTVEEAVTRVRNSKDDSKFAFIGDATEIRYYAKVKYCDELKQVGEEFSRKPYAIAVQQMSDMKDNISSAILQMLNKRELENMKNEWWTRRPSKDMPPCSDDDDDSDGISIENIGGVFIVILVGIVLSILTLLFEYWYYKDKRKDGDVKENGNTAENNGRTAIDSGQKRLGNGVENGAVHPIPEVDESKY